MAQVLDFESNGGRTSTGLEGSPGGVPLEFCAFPRELANWDEASRLPVWRLGCYASSPNGANVWTTSYMPGSNLAMASASWRNGSGAGSWRMA